MMFATRMIFSHQQMALSKSVYKVLEKHSRLKQVSGCWGFFLIAVTVSQRLVHRHEVSDFSYEACSVKAFSLCIANKIK